MQISLISFCKAKALAIHRLIGVQQSGSISFFRTNNLRRGGAKEGNRGFLSLVRLCVLSSYKERTCPAAARAAKERVSCAPKGDEQQKREAPVKGNFSLVWITSFENVQNENGRPPLEKRLPFCLYMLLCDFFRFGELFGRPSFCHSRKRFFLNNVGCNLHALYIRLRRNGEHQIGKNVFENSA